MPCCYCGDGRPIVQSADNHEVIITYVDKSDQFVVQKCTPGPDIESLSLDSFTINFCPYCGAKLFKEKENIMVDTFWSSAKEKDELIEYINRHY